MPHQVHREDGSQLRTYLWTETQECFQSAREGDHPELDCSELLNHEDTKIYQSLIGALQWVVQLGRIDIITAVMTMSRFRAAPRQGHMDRVRRIHGFINKMKHAIVRICTEEPDHSDIQRSSTMGEHMLGSQGRST
jgi:hypothetical protein